MDVRSIMNIKCVGKNMAMGEKEPKKSGVGNLGCHRFLTFKVRPE